MVALVPERQRAWHAGVSWWQGRGALNDVSLGIELVNPGHEWGYRPFPEPQMAALVELAGRLVRRWQIPPDRVVAHSDIAPARKEDPGELFEWRRLAAGGLCLADAVCRAGCRRMPELAAAALSRVRLSRCGAGRAARHALARLPAPLAARPAATACSTPRPWAWSLAVAGLRAGVAELARGRRAGGRMAAPACEAGEESPGSTGTRCRVTPGGGDPRESATESRPPAGAGFGRPAGKGERVR